MLTGNYVNFTQVGIVGEDAHAVIDDDNIARKIQVFGQPDHSGVGCINRCAGFSPKIRAPVVALQLTVEQPEVSKDAGGFAG